MWGCQAGDGAGLALETLARHNAVEVSRKDLYRHGAVQPSVTVRTPRPFHRRRWAPGSRKGQGGFRYQVPLDCEYILRLGRMRLAGTCRAAEEGTKT